MLLEMGYVTELSKVSQCGTFGRRLAPLHAAPAVPSPETHLNYAKRALFLLPLLLASALISRADTVYVSGSYSFADPSRSGYAISPHRRASPWVAAPLLF